MANNVLVLEGSMPDLNTMIAKTKRHWGAYSRVKDQYTQAVAWECKVQKVAHFKRVGVTIVWHCKNRKHDPDGIVGWATKPILDGLVMAGCLDNDGWKQIVSIAHKFAIDKKYPRIEVRLEVPPDDS